jgi:hypothetical protein
MPVVLALDLRALIRALGNLLRAYVLFSDTQCTDGVVSYLILSAKGIRC